jgi:hypothetical protein
MAVLTSAVISTGVGTPLAGAIGPHPARKIARIKDKAIRFFIEASLQVGLRWKTLCSPPRRPKMKIACHKPIITSAGKQKDLTLR